MQDDVSLQGALFLLFPFPLPHPAHTAFAPTRCLVDIRLCLKWLRTQAHTLAHTWRVVWHIWYVCMSVCVYVCIMPQKSSTYTFMQVPQPQPVGIICHTLSYIECVRLTLVCAYVCVCACAFHNCLLMLWRQRKRKSKWHILNLRAIDLYKKQRKYNRNVTFG